MRWCPYRGQRTICGSSPPFGDLRSNSTLMARGYTCCTNTATRKQDAMLESSAHDMDYGLESWDSEKAFSSHAHLAGPRSFKPTCLWDKCQAFFFHSGQASNDAGMSKGKKKSRGTKVLFFRFARNWVRKHPYVICNINLLLAKPEITQSHTEDDHDKVWAEASSILLNGLLKSSFDSQASSFFLTWLKFLLKSF